MLLPLLFLALPSTHTISGIEQNAASGSALMQSCQAELRLATSAAVADAVPRDLIGASYCIGYVNGFVGNVPEHQVSICTREQPMIDLVRVYVDFMQRNPRYLELDKRLGLRSALEEAFPCVAADASPSARARMRRDRL